MRFPVLVSALVAILAPSVHAQSNSQAKIQPHLVPVGGNNLCSPANALVPCAEIETAGDLSPALYYAYVLVTDGSGAKGVAGVQLGIDYDGTEASGVDVFSWTRCADLDFSTSGWPGAGTGSLITWSPDFHCQVTAPGGPGTGVVAAAGYFYVAAYTPDILSVTGHPIVGNAKVADCEAAESVIPASSLGTARFSAGGALPGVSPCVGVGPPEPVCSILGPSSVIESTTTTFRVDFNVPVTSISWSISGGGIILGSTTDESVQVQANPSYWFTLEVTFTTTTGTFTCSRTIDIEELSCSISGPSIVDANTTSTFGLSMNVTGAMIQWSVSGSGTIVGPANTTQVQVQTGAGGQFTLTATIVYTGGGTGECSKSVEINNQVFSCQISGLMTVTAGSSGNVYSVSTEVPATSIQWSISGNGTIVGSTTANQVSVTAGAAGSFTLSVAYSGPGSSGSCSMNVSVQGPPPQMTCSVSGPSSLGQGATGVYSVTANPAAGTWQWSVTGNGAISGSATGSTVQVLAGAPGSFAVSVTVTSGSLSTVCSMNVTVLATPQMTCSVSGPSSLVQGATGVYSVTSTPAAESWSWSVSGNGVINGSSTGPNVQVVAGAPGTFMVGVAVTSGSLSSQCSRIVSVFTTQPEGPNQGQAKIALHLTAPTSKSACAVRPGCGTIDTDGPGLYPGVSYYAYCLVANGYTSRAARSGVAGAQFGIHYNNAPGAGVDVFSWTLCATLDFPSTGWPASGGGNLITWDGFNACQQFEPEGAGTGVVATLGYFYLAAHSPDQLFITPRPVDGQAKVANCFGAESVLNGIPSPLGQAGFGGFGGYVPCGLAIPVENTTWSRIKTMIRED